MNSKQAKQIPIPDFLGKLGHKPKKSLGNDLWYISPLREAEHTASFKVNLLLNTWYDFGLAEGGTIIDLVCLMYNEDVRGALKRLEGNIPRLPLISNISPSKASKKSNHLILLEESEIVSQRLLDYLESRFIPITIAKKYLRQVKFAREGQESPFFGLGIKNDLGGYDYRNWQYKGFIGKGGQKSITTINPVKGNKVAIFEGFFDFLTFLAHNDITNFQSTAIILNSVTGFEQAIEKIRSLEPSKLYFYLDNDKTGKETLNKFTEWAEAEAVEFLDKSGGYSAFKDYNEFYVKFNQS